MTTATTDVSRLKVAGPVIHASSDYLPKLKARVTERERQRKLLQGKLVPVQPTVLNGTDTVESRVSTSSEVVNDGNVPIDAGNDPVRPPLKTVENSKPVSDNVPTQVKDKEVDSDLADGCLDNEASNFLDQLWAKMKDKLGVTTKCLNGGTKRSSDDCVCPQYFSGPKCEKRHCINNGTLVSRRAKSPEYCRCPHPEYITGNHCEIVKCMNGGRFNNGSCICVENWYTGRYCENYAASWFAVLGIPLIIIAVFAFCCVICRLDFCPRRSSSSRSGSRRNRAHSDYPSSSSQNSRRIVAVPAGHRCHLHDELPRANQGHLNPHAELANYHDFNPSLPPNELTELKPNEPPPTYDQAINGDSRPVPPDVVANFAHISALSPGPPPPAYSESEMAQPLEIAGVTGLP
uniref:EGF-like domain-containing protein n=1 Tax=Panagrellus redivivus TaxID=6233 RepID=A0A7E4ZTE2_PANRE